MVFPPGKFPPPIPGIPPPEITPPPSPPIDPGIVPEVPGPPGTVPPGPGEYTFADLTLAPGLLNIFQGLPPDQQQMFKATLRKLANQGIFGDISSPIGVNALISAIQGGNITGDARLAFFQGLFPGVFGAGGGGGGEHGGGGGFFGGPGGTVQFGDINVPSFENPQLTAMFQQLFEQGPLGANQGLFNQAIGGLLQAPQNPLGGLQGTLEGTISGLLGGQPSQALPEALRGQMEGSISELLGSQGLPQGVMEAVQNDITARLRSRERDLFERAGERAASRGLTDSGLLERAFGDIERDTTEALASQFSNLGLQSALQAAQQRSVGLGAAQGLGQLGLGESAQGLQRQGLGFQGAGLLGNLGLGLQQLGQQGQLGALGNILGLGQLNLAPLQIGTARELGLGRLGLGAADLELQRLQNEAQLNLLLRSGFFGAGEEQQDPLGALAGLGGINLFGGGGLPGGFGGLFA